MFNFINSFKIIDKVKRFERDVLSNSHSFGFSCTRNLEKLSKC